MAWSAVQALAGTERRGVSGWSRGHRAVIKQRVLVKAAPAPTFPMITPSVQVTAAPPRIVNADAAPSDGAC
jgi:hypothetical protein